MGRKIYHKDHLVFCHNDPLQCWDFYADNVVKDSDIISEEMLTFVISTLARHSILKDLHDWGDPDALITCESSDSDVASEFAEDDSKNRRVSNAIDAIEWGRSASWKVAHGLTAVMANDGNCYDLPGVIRVWFRSLNPVLSISTLSDIWMPIRDTWGILTSQDHLEPYPHGINKYAIENSARFEACMNEIYDSGPFATVKENNSLGHSRGFRMYQQRHQLEGFFEGEELEKMASIFSWEDCIGAPL